MNQAKAKPFQDWEIGQGFALRGPFVLDAGKSTVARTGIFVNLSFKEHQGDRFAEYGDGDHGRLMDLTGRVTKRDGAIRMSLTSGDEVTVRPLALEDAALLPEAQRKEWDSVAAMAQDISEMMS